MWTVKVRWCGGFVVTSDGDDIAECAHKGDAELIARLLSEYETSMQQESIKQLQAGALWIHR